MGTQYRTAEDQRHVHPVGSCRDALREVGGIRLGVAMQDRDSLRRASAHDLGVQPIERLLARSWPLDIRDLTFDQFKQRPHAEQLAGELSSATDASAAQQVVECFDEEHGPGSSD